MDANKKEGKKGKCQQHPVFPGGHPSKYWRGSMLLNFGDRTRTGVFSMIWPLTRMLANNQAFQLGSWGKCRKKSTDGANRLNPWHFPSFTVRSRAQSPSDLILQGSRCAKACAKLNIIGKLHLVEPCDWTSDSLIQRPWIWTFLSRSWQTCSSLTLRSGDTVTNDRIERCCYC